MPCPRSLPALLLALTVLTSAPAALAEPYDYGTVLVPSAINRIQGELNFAFSHRFQISTFPSGATPTLNFEYGIVQHLQIHTYFATQTTPGDFEAGLRYQFLDEYDGAWASMALRLAYASLGKTGIGELTISKNRLLDPLGIGIAWRGFTNPNNFGSFTHAAGLGLTIEVAPGFNLFGDTFVPFDKTITDRFGISWTSGIQWWIPDTPHVFMLFAGITGPGTTQGRTFSPGKDFGQQFRIGFEFSTLLDVALSKKKKKKKDQGSEE